jgi:ribose/xylose/arabinose/galactoside ABC-type transport system permease subunit
MDRTAKNSWRKWKLGQVSRLEVLRGIAILALFVFALTTPGFTSKPSLLSLLTTVSFIGYVAIGMTLITMSGNIMSFSLGATVGATAMIFIHAVNWGGTAFGVFAAMAFGATVSAVQGFVIGAVRANPIIVSIAALAIIYGVADAFSESGTIYAAPGANYGFLKGSIIGAPAGFVLLVVVTLVAQGLLSLTVFGRQLVMMGSSFRAAEAVGVRTWKITIGAYGWAGAIASLAGVMLAVRYDAASMSYGVGYDYDAVAAVLVGGTLMKGGQGSAVRTLIGALVIATVQVLLLLHGFRQEWQYFIAGLIILGVIMMQTRGTKDG